jgi:hypothetical protein
MTHALSPPRRVQLLGVLLTAILMLAAAGTALAASPPQGALTPLTGAGSCVGGGSSGCAPLRGITPATTATENTSSSVLTLTAGSGGRNLYVGGGIGTPWAIAVLDRNPRTGTISQAAGTQGCITAGRRAAGCAFVPAPGHINDLVISANGTRVATEYLQHGKTLPHQDEQLFARDPSTGQVHKLGGPRSCVALVSGVCGHVRGVTAKRSLLGPTAKVYQLGAGARLIAGPEGAGRGWGVAIERRNGNGRWREAAGTAGCADWHGPSGCQKVACLHYAVNGATSGPGGHVYVIGGQNSPAYVATFKRTSSGRLAYVGCALLPHRERASLPGKAIWVKPVPHSNTVLIATHYYDHEGPYNKEQIYATTPGKNGALSVPKLISPNLAFTLGDIPTLSPDGSTVYGADYLIGTGGLYVYHLTSTAVTPLPAPWFNPFSTPVASNGLHDNGVNDTPVVSDDGRFVYTVTGPFQSPSNTNQPEVRAYAAQP